MQDELYSVAETLVKKLILKKYTVATAESCTGGMISSTIVNVPGASEVINESYVTYSNEAKERIIGVKKETLDKFGAVSEETAMEMVSGVAKISRADCAISVTGIAGPGGGTEEKPVGTVYAGFYLRGTVKVKRYNFDGNRYEVRCRTTKGVMEDMLRLLENQ